MAQQARTPVALVDDPDLVASTHMVDHNTPNSSSRGADVLFSPPRGSGTHKVYIHTRKQNTLTHKHMKNKSKKMLIRSSIKTFLKTEFDVSGHFSASNQAPFPGAHIISPFLDTLAWKHPELFPAHREASGTTESQLFIFPSAPPPKPSSLSAPPFRGESRQHSEGPFLQGPLNGYHP